jgi:hypothetical protein
MRQASDTRKPWRNIKKQQATIVELVAGVPGRREQLSDLKRGQVAASGAHAPRVSLFSLRDRL